MARDIVIIQKLINYKLFVIHLDYCNKATTKEDSLSELSEPS